MEQFYLFDRDYNFNYVKQIKENKKISYNKNVTSSDLVDNFLKKKKEEESNK